MGKGQITTGVDDLIEYLKGKDRVAMQDVATVLDLPLETIQSWVDFLVEEKILGIEYKFTKPYIYINKESTKQRPKLIEETALSLEDVKHEYFEHARQKRIPEQKIAELWMTHVQEALLHKRAYFLEQAQARRVKDAEGLFRAYQRSLLRRCA